MYSLRPWTCTVPTGPTSPVRCRIVVLALEYLVVLAWPRLGDTAGRWPGLASSHSASAPAWPKPGVEAPFDRTSLANNLIVLGLARPAGPDLTRPDYTKEREKKTAIAPVGLGRITEIYPSCPLARYPALV